MISAPSSSACCVPWLAPCGLPPSSLIRSWMLGFWNSASAISAAFFIDCAATPALPAADSGRIRPTLTWPVPTACGCCGGPAGPASRAERIGKLASSDARAGAEQRRAENKADRRPPGRPRQRGPGSRLAIERARHRVSSLDRPLSAGTQPPTDQARWIQAYCRRIVNQNKRIMAARLAPVAEPAPCIAARPAFCRRIARLWRKRPVPSRLPLCAQNPRPKYGLKASRIPRAGHFRSPAMS